MSDPNERTWVVACHASALLGFFAPGVGHILPVLLVWLLKRAESPAVEEHGKESLNFQISMLLYNIVAGLLCLILVGFVFLAILHVANLILVIIASVKASEGTLYRYPFTLRLLK